MVRKNTPTGSAARFAAAWAELPPARQQQLVREIQGALREVRAANADHSHADLPESAAKRSPQIRNADNGRIVRPLKCQIRSADNGVTVVSVYDDVGASPWSDGGLTAKAFAEQLSGIRGPLQVRINSGGGDCFEGISIANTIKAHKGRVTTVVDGIAASIASVIAQAGQERVVQAGGMLMIHDAFGACVGAEDEMAKMAQTLGQVSDNIAAIYASRAGGTQESWRDSMRQETWYTAEQAVAAGLADRVGGGEARLPAGFDLAAYTAVPGRIAAALRKMPQAKAPAGGEDRVTSAQLAEIRAALREVKGQG